MKYEAIENFSGIVSAVKGEIIEISNKDVADDLVKAKFIKPVKTTKAEKK